MVQQVAVYLNTPDFSPPIIGMGRAARRTAAFNFAMIEFKADGYRVRRDVKATKVKKTASRLKWSGAPKNQVAKMVKGATIRTSDIVRSAKMVGRGGFIFAGHA